MGSAKERLKVYVKAKQIIAFKGDEDVIFELENKLIADKVSINLNEDSYFTGELEVNSLTAELNGDSKLDLEGSATKFELEAREDSEVKSYNFVINDLNIRLRGDSEARLTVNGQIDLRANGDSNFFYKGKGNIVRQHLSGDAEVKVGINKLNAFTIPTYSPKTFDHFNAHAHLFIIIYHYIHPLPDRGEYIFKSGHYMIFIPIQNIGQGIISFFSVSFYSADNF